MFPPPPALTYIIVVGDLLSNRPSLIDTKKTERLAPSAATAVDREKKPRIAIATAFDVGGSQLTSLEQCQRLSDTYDFVVLKLSAFNIVESEFMASAFAECSVAVIESGVDLSEKGHDDMLKYVVSGSDDAGEEPLAQILKSIDIDVLSIPYSPANVVLTGELTPFNIY